MDSKDERIVFLIRQEFRDENKNKSEIKVKYSNFAEKYPKLFDMICSDNCDDNLLNKMLSAKRLVNNGSMSQHDASVKVGQDLVNKYVIPNLPNDSNN